jgi:hypothetical protein
MKGWPIKVMKKTYSELDVSIVKFENEDIVTASSLMDLNFDELNKDNLLNWDELFGGV